MGSVQAVANGNTSKGSWHEADAGRPQQSRPPLPRTIVVATLLATAIFAIDVLTPFSFAIAVLYVLVVLVASGTLDRRLVLIVGGLCIALVLIAFVARHDLGETGALARAGVSVVAVLVATALILKNIRGTEVLASQAALLDLTHDAIFARSPDDVILSWNKGAEFMYGWTEAEAVGRRAAELLGADPSEARAEADGDPIANELWERQVRRSTRDGHQRIVLCRSAVERDPSGATRRIVETHSDVTERVEAELALEKGREELAHTARLSTLGELVASIAHEINQPLAAISASGDACLRWLRRDEPEIVEATASAERMAAGARRASDIVSRLRALARRSDPEQKRLVVNDLLDGVLPLLEREIRIHQIALRIERDRRHAEVVGDQIQLQQVLINLMINAMQAMDGVTDRPRNLGLAVATVREAETDRVVITVSDNGPGLPSEMTDNLFSPFFTTKPQGMGIGLSICRRIVEAHGGRITAMPAHPTGAVLAVSLPVAEEAPS